MDDACREQVAMTKHSVVEFRSGNDLMLAHTLVVESF